MKKTALTILSMLALTLTGCVKETKEQRDERYSHNIKVITYKGHDYIVLSISKYCNGIAHDPDCPCHEKGDDYSPDSLINRKNNEN